MTNGMYNQLREGGIKDLGLAVRVMNVSQGNSIKNVAVPRKEGYKYSRFFINQLMGDKYVPTEVDRKAWDLDKYNRNLISSEETLEFKSNLDSMMENAKTEADFDAIGYKLDEAKNNDYDIDLFGYTFKVCEKRNKLNNLKDKK